MKKRCKICIKFKEEIKFKKNIAICIECYKKLNTQDKNAEKKICEQCFYQLPLNSFNKSNKTSDGYSNTCKACKKGNDKFNKTVAQANTIIKCDKCKEIKSGVDFYRISDSHYRKACKACVKEITSHRLNTNNFKICRKCGEKMIASNYNFEIDIRIAGYLKNICKKCLIERK